MHNIHPVMGLPVKGAEPVECLAHNRHYLHVGVDSVGGVLKAFGFIMPAEKEIKARLKQHESYVKLPALPINKYVRRVGSPHREEAVFHLKPAAQVSKDDIAMVLDYPPDITPLRWIYEQRKSGVGVVTLESKQLKIPMDHDLDQTLLFQASSAQVALASLRILSMHAIMAQN